MTDIKIHKVNETNIYLECDQDIAMELHEYFSFYAKNYMFHPKFKAKVWNGKIYLFDIRMHTTYLGLIPKVVDFCRERNYSFTIDDELLVQQKISISELLKFVNSLDLPLEPRDYQLDAFVQAINNKRLVIVSATGSGKSFIIYLIIRWLQQSDLIERGLLVVPNINLVEQMYNDFIDYGYDSSINCHRIYGGKERDSNKFLTISTWQSLITITDKSYFSNFDFVIIDECHGVPGVSLTSVVSSCINASYKFGTTGTLDTDTTINNITILGLLGETYNASSTVELIKNKHLSDFNIKCIVLKHPEEIAIESVKWEYKHEIDYIIRNTKRNNFISNLALSLKGNTLLLFGLVEKHGKVLFELLKNNNSNKQLFFIYGNTDIELRENIRNIVETVDNAIIVASYSIYSTGVNIKNLHNIIFASPSKSKIRVLQSLGRVLRLADNKSIATLYDISDDIRYKKHINFTLKHYINRLKIYNIEKFNYTQHTLELK